MAKSIELTPAELQSQAAEMGALRSEYEALFSGVRSILKTTDSAWSTDLSSNFSGKIISLQNGGAHILEGLQLGEMTALQCAQGFESVDSVLARNIADEKQKILQENAKIVQAAGSAASILSNVSAGGGDFGGGGGGGRVEEPTSWLDRLKQNAKNKVDEIKTGVAKKLEKGNQVVSAIWQGLKADYENKGDTWKALNASKGVITAVGGLVAIVGAVTLSGASLGFGVGAASVAGVYGVNAVTQGLADVWNSFAGKSDQIGQVNPLKDALTGLGGAIGNTIGQKDIGENIGKMIYTVGSLIPTAAGISGLAENVKKANVTDLKGCVSVLKKVGETTSKLSVGAISAIGEVFTPGETYSESTLVRKYGKDSFQAALESVFNGIKSNAASPEPEAAT